MNGKPAWEQKISEAASRIEAELKMLVDTVDREVVPEVRKHGSSALRTLSEKLRKLADHMDEAKPTPPPSKEDPR